MNKPFIITDGETEIKFRAPSKLELSSMRELLLTGDTEKLTEVIKDLCIYPSPEEGLAWINNLEEEEYFKYLTIIGLLAKKVIERVREEYDKVFLDSKEKLETSPSMGITCFKALFKLPQEPSPEADAALEYLWETVTLVRKFLLK